MLTINLIMELKIFVITAMLIVGMALFRNLLVTMIKF